MTLLMMAGAGSGNRGISQLMAHTDLGYDPHNVMSVGIPIHDGTYKSWPERAAYFEKLHNTVAEVPGITMAAISSNATPPSNGFKTKLEIIGEPSNAEQQFQLDMVTQVFPCAAHSARAGAYLAMRRRIIAGRQ